MRHSNFFKEQYSFALIRAVASVASCDVMIRNVDINGVDMTIATTDTEEVPGEPKIDAQVKCTARNLVSGENIRFPLDAVAYEQLRSPVFTPRILLVVTVPEESDDWMEMTEEEARLRHSIYWVSLRDAPAVSNQTSVTVSLPRNQLLTPVALEQLLQRVGRGETL